MNRPERFARLMAAGAVLVIVAGAVDAAIQNRRLAARLTTVAAEAAGLRAVADAHAQSLAAQHADVQALLRVSRYDHGTGPDVEHQLAAQAEWDRVRRTAQEPPTWTPPDPPAAKASVPALPSLQP